MTERPKGAKEFQRLLQRHAAEIGQLPQRVMHLVRVGVVCAMLDDVNYWVARSTVEAINDTALSFRQ